MVFGPPPGFFACFDCSPQACSTVQRSLGAEGREQPASGRRGVGLVLITGMRGELVGAASVLSSPRQPVLSL